jgi:hypothetical protein
VRELREKFETFVDGPTDDADDRRAEIGTGSLRRCRFPSTDPRFMADCLRCAAEARVDVGPTTSLHPGTTETLRPTQDHTSTTYKGVPDRARLGCDWPYAVRRYNGGGVNAYHYQYETLLRLTEPPLAT